MRRSHTALDAALLVDLAPRKRGSFEDLVVAICREAQGRGHFVDVWAHEPTHEEVGRELRDAGARLRRLDDLRRAGPWALRGYDVAQLHLFGPRAPLALRAYAALPVRVQFVDHNSGPTKPTRSPVHRRLASAAVDRLVGARIADVAAVSGWVRARHAARFGRSDVITLHNGVDLDRFQARSEPARERPLLLCVANLIPEKGVDVLLDAVALLDDRSDVVVIGDGPELPRLQERVRSSTLADSVRFLGLRSDVHDWLARADVFVHPARWHEAFGLVIAEAMATGLPVVATRMGGIPEVVSEGETGFLVPPGDPTALAAVLEMLIRQPELRRALGAEARRRAEALFDLRRCARGYVDFLEKA